MLISPSDVFPDFILEQFGQFVLTILGTCNFRIFPNSGIGWGGGGVNFPLSQWGELEILLEDFFSLGGRNLRRSNFDDKPFSKLKTAFCEY